jgi:UDP-glucose 4-epimerase
MLTDKRIVITGGTGSLGRKLVQRMLSRENGKPGKIIVFSRDEAKQHAMRLKYQQLGRATDEIIYRDLERILQFQIGDVRNYHSVCSALQDADIVFNAAALKQVPTCEYFPYEAVRTNIEGAENIVRAIRENQLPVETVVGVSTDKACKPVNVMGMTKAIQERIFIRANLDCPQTRFVCVRYGNVLASRGSVIPLFHDQILRGEDVTITTLEMTRFLISLDEAVDTIFAAFKDGKRGETYIPRIPSGRVIDIAEVLIGDRPIQTRIIGIRPGEKVHEILVSEEESHRTIERNGYYVVTSILPEIRGTVKIEDVLGEEYSSADNIVSKNKLAELLGKHGLLVEDQPSFEEAK